MEKLNMVLEDSIDSKELRKVLQEITFCSSCLCQGSPESGSQQSKVLNHYATEFRNWLYHTAEELER